MPSRDTMISILSHMLNVIYYHRSRGKKSTVKVFWGSHLDNNSSLINFSGVFLLLKATLSQTPVPKIGPDK